MKKSERINGFMLITLIIGFLLGSSLIYAPGLAEAKQDTWIALFLSIVLGFVMLYIYVKLSEKYPGLTFVEYSEAILGKFLGKIVGFIYIWFAFQLATWVLRNFGDYIVATILPETPLEIVLITFVMISVYAVYKGLEVIARTSQVLVPIFIFSFVMIILLILKELNFSLLMPILNTNPKQLSLATLTNFSFPFSELIIFAMIFPYVNSQHKTFYTAAIGLLIGGLILLIKTILIIIILGAEFAVIQSFPFHAITRLINIADIIQRLDAITVIGFMMTGFLKVAICYYACVLGIGKLLNLKDHKPLILPIGALMTAYAVVVYPNSIVENFANKTIPIYTFPIKVIIPILLLIIAVLRESNLFQKKSRDNG